MHFTFRIISLHRPKSNYNLNIKVWIITIFELNSEFISEISQLCLKKLMPRVTSIYQRSKSIWLCFSAHFSQLVFYYKRISSYSQLIQALKRYTGLNWQLVFKLRYESFLLLFLSRFNFRCFDDRFRVFFSLVSFDY